MTFKYEDNPNDGTPPNPDYRDFNGNMIQRVKDGVTLNILYNYENKPTVIKNEYTDYVSFSYDGNGQRVKKVSNSNTVLYFGESYEVRNGIATLHLFAGNKRVVSLRFDGSDPDPNKPRLQFHHGNHLGSASVVTDSNGDIKQRIEYFPFGTYRITDPPGPQGTWDFDTEFPNANYTFTDHEDDDELGFYNYGARLYDPVIGRFISPDRVVQAPENPQTLNRYSYCLNNPLIYTDPSGEIFGIDDAVFWMLVGAVVGAGYGAATAHRNGMSFWEGAFSGGVIGWCSGAVGGVGGIVAKSWATNALTWIVSTASKTYGSAVAVVGAMGGGLAGGATAGTMNAAMAGTNVWKGALYGGLTGAAIAGLVQGAIELFSPSAAATTSASRHNWQYEQAPGWGDAELVAAKALDMCPAHVHKFVNDFYADFGNMGRDLNIDPDLLMALSSLESGWNGPEAQANKNLWGLTEGGGRNLSFDSYWEGNDYWASGWGKRLSGSRDIGTFTSKLTQGPVKYNVSPGYAGVIENQYYYWMRIKPSCWRWQQI